MRRARFGLEGVRIFICGCSGYTLFLSTRFCIRSAPMVRSRTLGARRWRRTKSAPRQMASRRFSRQLSRRRSGSVRNGGMLDMNQHNAFVIPPSHKVFSEFSKQTRIVLCYLAYKFDAISPENIHQKGVQNALRDCSARQDLGLKKYTVDELKQYTVEFAFNSSSTSPITAYYVPNDQSTLSAIQKANAEYNAWLSKCSWGGSLFSLTGTTVSAATSLVDSAVSTVTRLGSDVVSSANTYFNTKDLSKIPSKIVVQKEDKHAIKDIAKNILKPLENCDIKDMHIASDTNRKMKNAVLKYMPDGNRLFIEIPVSQGKNWMSKKLTTASILQLPSNSDCQKKWTIDRYSGEVQWTFDNTNEYAALSKIQVTVTSEPDKQYLDSRKPTQVLGGKRLRALSLHKHDRTRRRHANNIATHTNRAPKKDRRMGGMHPASLVKKKATDLAGDVQRGVRDSFTDNKYKTFKLDSVTAPTIDATFVAAFKHVCERHKLVYKDFLTVYQQYYAVREGELFLSAANETHFLTFCAQRLQYVYPHNVTGTALIERAMMQDKVFRNFILEGTNKCTTSVTDIWKNMGEKAGTMFKEPFPFTLSTSRGEVPPPAIIGVRVDAYPAIPPAPLNNEEGRGISAHPLPNKYIDRILRDYSSD